MDSTLNTLIDNYIIIESEINQLTEELKPKNERLKELRSKLSEYKTNIENDMIEKEKENYKYKDYTFGIVERKQKNKPKPDEYNNIIYSELKTKMEKEEAEKSTNNITMEINGGEIQRIKKVNVKKPRKKVEKPKTERVKKTKKN